MMNENYCILRPIEIRGPGSSECEFSAYHWCKQEDRQVNRGEGGGENVQHCVIASCGRKICVNSIKKIIFYPQIYKGTLHIDFTNKINTHVKIMWIYTATVNSFPCVTECYIWCK